MISPAEQPCPGAVAIALLMTGSRQVCSQHRNVHSTGMFTAQLWPWLRDPDNKGCNILAQMLIFGENGKKAQRWAISRVHPHLFTSVGSRARGCTPLGPVTCPKSSLKERHRGRLLCELESKTVPSWANPCSLYMPTKHQHCLCTTFS